MSLSFGTSEISPISLFASLGATPDWTRYARVGQRTTHTVTGVGGGARLSAAGQDIHADGDSPSQDINVSVILVNLAISRWIIGIHRRCQPAFPMTSCAASSADRS
jgi:hypothetical protein